MDSQKRPTLSENSRLSKVERLFLEHLPAYKDCPHLMQWLEWADSCGFLVTISPTEHDDSLIGALVARPITLAQLEQPYDSYTYSPDGDLLYIDAAVVPNKADMRAFGLAVLARFGRRAGVAFTHRGQLKVHDHYTAAKALFKRKT